VTEYPHHRKHWTDRAACKGTDTDTFFNDRGKGLAPTLIVRICQDCPIKYECRLAGYAEYDGYWGNSTARERNRSRVSIFGRVYGLFSRIDEDNLDNFRQWVNAILRKKGTLHSRLKAAGLNDQEIGMFFKRTKMDERGARLLARQDNFKTDHNWALSVVPKAARMEGVA
jgi:WhiB family redox-sensing transcriptional regulator